MNLLVVEDDLITRLMLVNMLTRLGYEVTMAEDGDAAWILCQTQRIEIIISDWMMPHTDGLELCRRLRARPNTDYTYFILLTRKGERSDRLEALQVGADDFLSKPLDQEELMARLEVARRILTMQQELKQRTTELEDANRQLQSLAMTDSMTGLANHRVFQEQLQQEVTRAQDQGTPLALLLLDVDKFKQYNDSFGHPAGDVVLKTMAERLRDSLGAEACVARCIARYGGEEFAILLPNIGVEVAQKIAERVRANVEAHTFPYRCVTLSIGVALFSAATKDATALVTAADRALYTAKYRGRNRVVLASEEILKPEETSPSLVLVETTPPSARERLLGLLREPAGQAAIGVLLAQELERCGRQGTMEGIEALCAALEIEYARLEEDMREAQPKQKRAA